MQLRSLDISSAPSPSFRLRRFWPNQSSFQTCPDWTFDRFQTYQPGPCQRPGHLGRGSGTLSLASARQPHQEKKNQTITDVKNSLKINKIQIPSSLLVLDVIYMSFLRRKLEIYFYICHIYRRKHSFDFWI